MVDESRGRILTTSATYTIYIYIYMCRHNWIRLSLIDLSWYSTSGTKSDRTLDVSDATSCMLFDLFNIGLISLYMSMILLLFYVLLIGNIQGRNYTTVFFCRSVNWHSRWNLYQWFLIHRTVILIWFMNRFWRTMLYRKQEWRKASVSPYIFIPP